MVDKPNPKLRKSLIKVTIETVIRKETKKADSSVVSLSVGLLTREFSLRLSEVIAVDEILAAPSVTSSPNVLSCFRHLKDITFSSVDKASVTMPIGNDL